MSQNMTALGNVAMNIYDKVVHDQVFSKNVLYKNILSNVARQQGATTKYLSVHYGRNIGFAAGTETFTLPTAGNQGYSRANVTMKYLFHQIAVTDVALQASKRSKELLVDVLESEYNGAKEDMQRQLSRQGYADGSGVICRVNQVTPLVACIFDTPMVGKYPTDYFPEPNTTATAGGPIAFNDTANDTSVSLMTTVTYVTGNYTATVNSVAAVADDDYVFLAHANGTATPTVMNYGKELMGLKGLIDDASNVDALEGITRSTSIWWKSYVNDSATETARSLTEALLQTTFLEAKKKGNPKYALTSFDVFSAYGQLLATDRRYTSEMTLGGGFTGVKFNDIALVADYDCPFDEVYFIDPSTISIEDLAPMSFLNEDGSILDRSSTTPTWNATLRYYANLCTSAPNKNASLRDVIA